MEKFKEWILSVQHLFAMFGATVLVPILVGIEPNIAMLTAGIGTLIFHLCTKCKVPVFLGSSFAFIAPILVITQRFNDYAYVQGSTIIVGLLYLVMALLVYKIGVERINKLLPPYIVGTMIIIIGLSLIPSAINNIKTNVLIAGFTLLVSVLITFAGKGFVKQLGILIGVISGYLLASVFGIVDFNVISKANWLFVPKLSAPKFSIDAIVIMAPLALCTMLEHIGDITTNGAVVGKNFIKDPGLHRTLAGDGLATLTAGLLGSVPNTTYGENTSLLAITKNYDPKILRRTAIIAIIFSFFGKFGGVVRSIPACVVGGISLQLYCMIAWIGIKQIKDFASMEYKEGFVVGVMLIIGLSDLVGVSAQLTIGTVVVSGMSLAVIVGIILNVILEVLIKEYTA